MGFFFRKKKHEEHTAKAEEQIQAIKKDTTRKIDAATRSSRRLRDLLEADGFEFKIYAGLGGDQRRGGKINGRH